MRQVRPKAPIDFLILASSYVEFDLLKSLLASEGKQLPPRRTVGVYYSARLGYGEGTSSRYTLIVALQSAAGLTQTQRVTAEAIRTWNPSYVIQVGTGVGLARAGICVGDILISEAFATYRAQDAPTPTREAGGEIIRPNELLLRQAQLFGRRQRPTTDAPSSAAAPPKLHFGGVCIFPSELSVPRTAAWIESLPANVIGVELEGHGISTSFTRGRAAARFLTIQGVASLGDSSTDPRGLFIDARTSLFEGIHVARDCGYGIFHIDLLLESAQLHLLCGEPQQALEDLRIALDEGLKPPTNSSLPRLLAANDPDCGYAWGIAEGGHLRAEALLLQAAQTLGCTEFRADTFTDLPATALALIESAREELKQCLECRRRIRDPKINATQATLDRLDTCRLTEYPLNTKPMKLFSWITNGLSAATAALSTAPPDQWADGRVVVVATSTFLLEALQGRLAERENASREEVIAGIRKCLDDFEQRLGASETGTVTLTAALKETLNQQLTAVAMSVEACQGRIC